MRIFFVLMATAALCACQPNDTRVKTAKQLLDEGEVLEFTEPGFRHKGCREQRPNYLLRVTDEPERARVVVGKQGSIITPGVFNCYRVGSTVGIESYRNRKLSKLPGEVRVTKISWARVDKVTKSRMKGRYFAANEQFNDYMNGVKRVLANMGQQYVAIIDFDYVSGSAVDEKAIIDEDKKNNESDGYAETTEDGKCLGRCPSKLWVDTEIPQEFQPLILDKSLGSWFQLRQDTGFQQGAEILLKTNRNDTEGFARARIKKVKRFKYWALSDRFFNTVEGFDFKKLRTFIQVQNVRFNSEWVTVIDLEILPPLVRQGQAEPTDCRSRLHLNRELPAQAKVKIAKDQEPCSQPGSLLNVVTVDRDDSILEIPVRVKARLEDKESTTTTLILERLDQTEQELP